LTASIRADVKARTAQGATFACDCRTPEIFTCTFQRSVAHLALIAGDLPNTHVSRLTISRRVSVIDYVGWRIAVIPVGYGQHLMSGGAQNTGVGDDILAAGLPVGVDNDWVGIGGFNITGALVERNEIYRNYLAKLSPDTATGEASGVKFVKTREVTVRNNYVHGNFGVGVWFDGDNVGTLIEGNVISGNTYRGVMDEVSFGAIIRQNTITGNGRSSGWIGGAGILIATASGVEVCGNVVKGNAQGIVGFQQDRGTGSMGRFVTSHNHVHDNYITMSEGITGLTGGAENDPTNVFYQNHYCLTNDAGFIWGNKTYSKGSQAAGHDLRGTFSCGF
jgi:parallel beta-helix repeat protein